MEFGFLFFLSLFLGPKKKTSWIIGIGGESKTRTTARGSICPHRFNFRFFWGGAGPPYDLRRTLIFSFQRGLVCSFLLDGCGWGIFDLMMDVVLSLGSSGGWCLGIFALLRDVV